MNLKFWKNWDFGWVVVWSYSVFAFLMFAVTAFQVESFGDKLVSWIGAIGFSLLGPVVLYLGGREQRKYYRENPLTTVSRRQ